MKKITLFLLLSGLAKLTLAQTTWTTDDIHISDDRNAKLGTADARSLYFTTHDTTRVIIDSLGNMVIPGLGNRSGIYHPVYASPAGLVCIIAPDDIHLESEFDQSTPCKSNTNPWYEGGNTIIGTGNNIIGTCNNVDFLLETNQDIVMDLKAAVSGGIAMVGIGKGNAPSALLDISDPRGTLNASGVKEHTYIHGDGVGGIEATYDMNLFFGNGFHINQGTYGSGNNNMLNLDDSGNFSLYNLAVAANGTTTIGAGLAPNNAMLTVGQANKNNPAFILTDNTSTTNKDFFKVYGSGYTEINMLSSSAIPNDRILAVRNATNQASITDLFVVKSNGKVYAREVEVSNVQPFPDYVFTKDYKLRPIAELESYIQKNAHLPGFEKGEYYEKNGINVNTMFVKQQEKIEELTLYIIELEKRLAAIEKTK